MAWACRPVVTVQTYHAALSMAEYGWAPRLWTAAPPRPPTATRCMWCRCCRASPWASTRCSLAQRPGSVLARAMTQEMRKALRELLGEGA
jgi:hypothetical protein